MSDTTQASHEARQRREHALLTRYHRTLDPRHREELVENFLPLSRSLARRYAKNPETLDDLEQVAAVGLIKAVERFDPSRGVAFSSYAVPTILGELKRYFRDYGWTVRLPRELGERARRVELATECFVAEHGRVPTVAEVAGELGGVDEEHVLEALHASRAASVLSLDAPLDEHDSHGRTLADRIGVQGDEFDAVEDRVLLDGLLRMLTPRERRIVRMRFIEDRSQADIGAVFGVSQMQISRILRQAIERLQRVTGRQQGEAVAVAPDVNATVPLA